MIIWLFQFIPLIPPHAKKIKKKQNFKEKAENLDLYVKKGDSFIFNIII